MFYRRIMILAFLYMNSVSSLAEINIDPVLEIGIERGGDELITTSEEDLLAGGGLYFGGGVTLEQPGSELKYRVLLGYITDEIDFIQPIGSSSFSTLPINAGLFKTAGSHEFGGGLSYHLNPEWELCINGFGCETASFDDALGIFGEYHYSFGNNGYIGVKLTLLEYEIETVDIDGDSLGLVFGYYLK